VQSTPFVSMRGSIQSEDTILKGEPLGKVKSLDISVSRKEVDREFIPPPDEFPPPPDELPEGMVEPLPLESLPLTENLPPPLEINIVRKDSDAPPPPPKEELDTSPESLPLPESVPLPMEITPSPIIMETTPPLPLPIELTPPIPSQIMESNPKESVMQREFNRDRKHYKNVDHYSPPARRAVRNPSYRRSRSAPYSTHEYNDHKSYPSIKSKHISPRHPAGENSSPYFKEDSNLPDGKSPRSSDGPFSSPQHSPHSSASPVRSPHPQVSSQVILKMDFTQETLISIQTEQEPSSFGKEEQPHPEFVAQHVI